MGGGGMKEWEMGIPEGYEDDLGWEEVKPCRMNTEG